VIILNKFYGSLSEEEKALIDTLKELASQNTPIPVRILSEQVKIKMKSKIRKRRRIGDIINDIENKILEALGCNFVKRVRCGAEGQVHISFSSDAFEKINELLTKSDEYAIT
jgi:hypothetical protein